MRKTGGEGHGHRARVWIRFLADIRRIPGGYSSRSRRISKSLFATRGLPEAPARGGKVEPADGTANTREKEAPCRDNGGGDPADTSEQKTRVAEIRRIPADIAADINALKNRAADIRRIPADITADIRKRIGPRTPRTGTFGTRPYTGGWVNS